MQFFGGGGVCASEFLESKANLITVSLETTNLHSMMWLWASAALLRKGALRNGILVGLVSGLLL